MMIATRTHYAAVAVSFASMLLFIGALFLMVPSESRAQEPMMGMPMEPMMPEPMLDEETAEDLADLKADFRERKQRLLDEIAGLDEADEDFAEDLADLEEDLAELKDDFHADKADLLEAEEEEEVEEEEEEEMEEE